MRTLIIILTLFLTPLYTHAQIEIYKKLQEKGRDLLIQGEYLESVKIIDSSLKIMPSSSISHYEKAYALMQLEKYEDAITSFDEVIRLAPGKYYAFSNRAICHIYLGNLSAARKDISRALELDPKNKMALEIEEEVIALIRIQEEKNVTKFDARINYYERMNYERRRANEIYYLNMGLPLLFWTTIFLTW